MSAGQLLLDDYYHGITYLGMYCMYCIILQARSAPGNIARDVKAVSAPWPPHLANTESSRGAAGVNGRFLKDETGCDI